MAYKRKTRILKVIRKSAITGKAVWIGIERTYKNEWQQYKRACWNEITRMRGWGYVVARRKKNLQHLLNELTARLPVIGDIQPEKREAAKALIQMVADAPKKQSNFYDHIQAEKRQKRNADRRIKRRKEKERNANYDK